MMHDNKLKLIIAEANYLLRTGLRIVIEKNDEVEVIKEISAEKNLVQQVKLLKPDILIVNPQLFANVPANVSAMFPDKLKTKFIPFLYDDTTSKPLYAADSYIMLSSSERSIARILKKVTTGIRPTTPKSQSSQLTEREKTVLKLIAQGMTSRQIGEKLFISEQTVMVHRKHITAKLGIKSVSGLTVYAVLNKIINIEAEEV